jgi:hypothetical protein
MSHLIAEDPEAKPFTKDAVPVFVAIWSLTVSADNEDTLSVPQREKEP